MDNTNSRRQPALAGARVRALRRQRHMSIKVFAEKTGISVGHVSQIERNLIEPSLSVVRRMCEVLGVAIHTLLADDAGDLMLVRHGAQGFSFADSTAVYRTRTPALLRSGRLPQLGATTGCIPARQWDHAEPVTHEGDEYVYVVRGRIEYHTDEGVYAAGAGDSLYVKAGTPHRMYNPLWEASEVLAFFSGPWHGAARLSGGMDEHKKQSE